MKLYLNIFCYVLVTSLSICCYSQTIVSKAVDFTTKEAIPYAFITIGSHGVVADAEGHFEIQVPKNNTAKDSLKIASIGYFDKLFSIDQKIAPIIYLKRETFVINEVVITNSRLSLKEILKKVEELIDTNYRKGLDKKSLFFRQKDNNKINRIEIDFKKSTIKELTQSFVNNELSQMPKTSAFYTDVLGDSYGGKKNRKLNILKAVKFYDTYSNGYLDTFYEKLESILNANIKKDSYFKIKSGIFSINANANQEFIANGELLDMRNEISKKEEVNANFFLENRKKTLDKVFDDVFYKNSSPLNFIFKQSRYSFEWVDTIVYGDDLAYKIKFFPNGGEDFKGVFYVNTNDFAILRIDYQNVAKLRSIKLFGFNFVVQGRKGIMLFEKYKDDKYILKYIEKIEEDKYGIDRPIKIIEKNKVVKGRNKQNEISADLDFVSTVEREFKVLIYTTDSVSENQLKSQIESKEEQPKNWAKYDIDFWNNNIKASNFESQIQQLKSIGN